VNANKVIKKARKFAKPFRISHGEKFRLKDVDPGDTLVFRFCTRIRKDQHFRLLSEKR